MYYRDPFDGMTKMKDLDGVDIYVDQNGSFHARLVDDTGTGRVVSRSRLLDLEREILKYGTTAVEAIWLSGTGRTGQPRPPRKVKLVGVERRKNAWGQPRYRSADRELHERYDLYLYDHEAFQELKALAVEQQAVNERIAARTTEILDRLEHPTPDHFKVPSEATP